jgi:hypothetical protein
LSNKGTECVSMAPFSYTSSVLLNSSFRDSLLATSRE